MIHEVEHQLLKDHAQPACAHLTIQGFYRDRADSAIGKAQVHTFVIEEPLVLLENGITRFAQDFDECRLIQFVENTDDWQTSYKFGDEAELDQVLRLCLAEQLSITLRTDRDGIVAVFF